MATRKKSNGLVKLGKLRMDDVECEVVEHSGMLVCSAMWKGHRVTRKYMGYRKREAIKMFIDEVCV